MSIITGKDLRKLGFKKSVEMCTSEPEVEDYHYYTYEINDKCLLMSCSNDEKINGGYVIEFYEMEGLKFDNLKQLKKLFKLLKQADERN